MVALKIFGEAHATDFKMRIYEGHLNMVSLVEIIKLVLIDRWLYEYLLIIRHNVEDEDVSQF